MSLVLHNLVRHPSPPFVQQWNKCIAGSARVKVCPRSKGEDDSDADACAVIEGIARVWHGKAGRVWICNVEKWIDEGIMRIRYVKEN
jgi:hypothetical protein